MLNVPTVFVIGAGAGRDIDMPVGSTLSGEIAHKLNIRHKDFGSADLKSGDPFLAGTLRRIAKERNEDYNAWRDAGCTVATGIEYTRSIDAYLNTHRDNEKVKICGKLAIAQCILEHEKGCVLFMREGAQRGFQRRDRVMNSWLSDFLYLLQDRIVASENLDSIFRNLVIINFNYDRCVEHFLLHALQELYRIDENRAAKLMLGLRIFHPYGLVGHLPWDVRGERKVGFGASDYGDFPGLAHEIRTFNEQLEEGAELKEIRAEVAKAARVVFLGFHFHRQNMELLHGSGPARGGVVNSYATAVERSDADKALIDREIRKMLEDRGGSWNVFVDQSCDCKKLFKDYGETWLR